MPSVSIRPYAQPSPSKEDRTVGVGGCGLHYQVWKPDDGPTAVVIICPGIDDHSDRYPHLVSSLAAAGYAIVAYDHRGNGRSDGVRLHVDRFQHYVEDLDTIRQMALGLWPSLPWFLFAHSMGTTVALSYLVQGFPPPRGLIASATALLVGAGFSPLLLTINRLVAGIAPKARLVGLPREGITREPRWNAWGDVDPLVARRSGTARLGTELLAALERVRPLLDQVTLPLLVLHGTADRLTDVEGARLLYHHAASQEKTLRLYQDAYHELVNDLPDTREEVLRDIVEWLGERVAP